MHRVLFALIAWLSVGSLAVAFPLIELLPTVAESHVDWQLSVRPDVATFVPNNTSLAVELDIDIAGTLLEASLNEEFWNVVGINPGNNPFTGEQALGLVVDLENDTIFVAAGSELLATSAAVPVLTFKTTGQFFGISIGGRPVLAGTPEAYESSRIAQNGINYDGIVVDIVPHGPFIPGDFDGDGRVANGDLTLLLDHWSDAAATLPAAWIGDRPPPGTFVDNEELTLLLDGWGTSHGGIENNGVPEPSSWCLAVFLCCCTLATTRINCCRP